MQATQAPQSSPTPEALQRRKAGGRPSTQMAHLTRDVKALAKQFGAALVGVASIDRFDPHPPYYDRPPRGHDPRDFVPGAQAVISIAQPVLNAFMEAPAALADEDLELVPPELKYPYLEMLYNIGGHRTQDYQLEQVGQVVGQLLQAQGYDTMYFPTAGIHPRPDRAGTTTERQWWEGSSRECTQRHSAFRYTNGPFSHRHAATRAGLGEFGFNNIVLTPEFGPRQRFNSIITTAPLAADPLITEPICLREACMLCLQACPMHALTLRDDPNVVDYRSVEAVESSRIFIDTPAKTEAPLCIRRKDPPGSVDIPATALTATGAGGENGTGHTNGASRANGEVDADGITTRCFYGDCIRICPLPAEPARLSRRLRKVRGF